MDCCQCQGIECQFDRRRVQKKLTAYRKKGPDATTRILLDALKAEDVQGMTLLDIGGGVGVIQHELLQAGVHSASSVEASAASIDLAKEEAVRQGHADRITYYHGDFTEVAPTLPAADVVTLDRVICCYHDMPSLVRLSAGRARRLYGVVYPRDTWWMKLVIAIQNAGYWLRRDSFRLFVHPTRAVDALIRQHGLRPCFEQRTHVWQIVVYKKTE
jgi:2-polyprenyl-3-methyl-5-hydroxy-6-metoxy-1,4-benzoquinol methylase